MTGACVCLCLRVLARLACDVCGVCGVGGLDCVHSAHLFETYLVKISNVLKRTT